MAEANEDDFEFDVETPDIEVEDDTPPEDRGRSPMPKEIVDELEADELEDYSEKVKVRLKQLKKVYHDERREKEQVKREHNEAVAFAQRALEENRQLRNTLNYGEQTLVSSYKDAAQMEADAAKRAYKEAYEAGDSDKLVEANEKLAAITYRLNQLNGYRPALQNEEPAVYSPQAAPAAPALDPKTLAWQERNSWWGTDSEMTASALGLHQKLEQQNGKDFVGTDEYWRTIDTTMKRRFPEYYGDETSGDKPSRSGVKPSTVVAPASRSTSSRKIVLKQSQVALAKKLGLTNEQYAREMMKLEKNNG
jgi:hypothetical protein